MPTPVRGREFATGVAMVEPDAALDDLARRVIGAAIEVHSTLGPGFLEGVYEEALAVEMRLRGIAFTRQAVVELGYKGERVGETRLDFLVERQLVLELKAVEGILPIHLAQVRSYLRATGARLGLLINFNTLALKAGGIKRIVLTS